MTDLDHFEDICSRAGYKTKITGIVHYRREVIGDATRNIKDDEWLEVEIGLTLFKFNVDGSIRKEK